MIVRIGSPEKTIILPIFLKTTARVRYGSTGIANDTGCTVLSYPYQGSEESIKLGKRYKTQSPFQSKECEIKIINSLPFLRHLGQASIIPPLAMIQQTTTLKRLW